MIKRWSLAMDTADFATVHWKGFWLCDPAENVMRIYDWEISGSTRPLTTS